MSIQPCNFEIITSFKRYYFEKLRFYNSLYVYFAVIVVIQTFKQINFKTMLVYVFVTLNLLVYVPPIRIKRLLSIFYERTLKNYSERVYLI